MLLRPRQKLFVERSVRALDEHGDTLGVAPTGAGKTIMLSAVVGRMLGGNDAKACVLAHRDELTAQNRAKFARVNPGDHAPRSSTPGRSPGRARSPSPWCRRWRGPTTSTPCRRSTCW